MVIIMVVQENLYVQDAGGFFVFCFGFFFNPGLYSAV